MGGRKERKKERIAKYCYLFIFLNKKIITIVKAIGRRAAHKRRTDRQTDRQRVTERKSTIETIGVAHKETTGTSAKE